MSRSCSVKAVPLFRRGELIRLNPERETWRVFSDVACDGALILVPPESCSYSSTNRVDHREVDHFFSTSSQYRLNQVDVQFQRLFQADLRRHQQLFRPATSCAWPKYSFADESRTCIDIPVARSQDRLLGVAIFSSLACCGFRHQRLPRPDALILRNTI